MYCSEDKKVLSHFHLGLNYIGMRYFQAMMLVELPWMGWDERCWRAPSWITLKDTLIISAYLFLLVWVKPLSCWDFNPIQALMGPFNNGCKFSIDLTLLPCLTISRIFFCQSISFAAPATLQALVSNHSWQRADALYCTWRRLVLTWATCLQTADLFISRMGERSMSSCLASPTVLLEKSVCHSLDDRIDFQKFSATPCAPRVGEWA